MCGAVDTTVAELIKTVTDKERFLDLVQAEHGELAPRLSLPHSLHPPHKPCICFFFIEIREEDFSDRPHPYVEKLLGNTSQHPIEKV